MMLHNNYINLPSYTISVNEPLEAFNYYLNSPCNSIVSKLFHSTLKSISLGSSLNKDLSTLKAIQINIMRQRKTEEEINAMSEERRLLRIYDQILFVKETLFEMKNFKSLYFQAKYKRIIALSALKMDVFCMIDRKIAGLKAVIDLQVYNSFFS